MRLSLSVGIILLSSLAAAAGGIACSGRSGDSTDTTTAEGLTALTPDEILGTLTYGQTSAPVAYNDTPRYRAFRFTGNQGDAVDALVSSTNAHPRAWILNADSSNLAYSTADGTQSQIHVTATLPAAGTYYIAFRDYFLEDGTFTVSLKGPPPPPQDAGTDTGPACDPEVSNCDGGPGNIVHGADRTIALPRNANNANAETWGKGLWDGYISFVATLSTPDGSDNFAAIVDATGTSYSLSNGVGVPFQRLPLPVTLKATSTDGDGATVSFTKTIYEVTATHPIPAQSLKGKYSGTDVQNVTVIGSDIPGVSLTVTTGATFFNNFTNGNACDQLLLNNKVLSPSAASGSFVFTAPLTIQSVSTCISSRLASPEDANEDFTIGLSSITVGNPQ